MIKKIIILAFILNSLTYANSNSYYIVKKGDNLGKISKKYKVNVKKIISLNKIKNPNLIYPGMKLKLKNELVDLARSYELKGDKILENMEIALAYKVQRSLENYKVAKKLYTKNNDISISVLDEKILKLNSLKTALNYQNIGNIYKIKNEKDKEQVSYSNALKYYQKYATNNEIILTEVSQNIKYLEKVILGGENVKENI